MQYVCSDLHFYHGNILKYCPKSRPFSCVEEMNEKIIDNWNNKINSKDDVYMIGDISFGKPYDTISLIKRLNGKKHLIIGNHDGDKYLKEEEFCDSFHSMKLYSAEKLFGKIIIMFHFPILEWDKKHHGSYHFHGHCHSVNKQKLSCRRFDVGIDGSPDFAPYEIESLLTDIENRINYE